MSSPKKVQFKLVEGTDVKFVGKQSDCVQLMQAFHATQPERKLRVIKVKEEKQE